MPMHLNNSLTVGVQRIKPKKVPYISPKKYLKWIIVIVKVNPEMDFLLGSNAALKVSCLVGGH